MTTKTLRFYEDRGLMPPPTRAGNGYREYPQDAVELLGFIRRGRAAGLSLSQIRTIFKSGMQGIRPASTFSRCFSGS